MSSEREVGGREWFNDLIEEVGIVFIHYPVSGSYPYLPFGAKLARALQRELERRLEESGHEPIIFPSLIPLSLFRKEVDFFEGFSPEALVAEKTLSGRELGEPLILRPTSEVPIYFVFSQLIHSWRDLPKKVYQTVTVYRVETSATAPLFRLREVTLFNEEHVFTKGPEEAEALFEEAIRLYSEYLEWARIPHLIVETPPWDLFPGASRNVDLITFMPDGKILELASVINFRDKFAKAFEIRYMGEDGVNRFVHQITYGIGIDRVLGAHLWLHSDERGLTIHPDIAPLDAVVIPIFKEETKEGVMRYVEESVVPALRSAGLSFIVDTSEKTPGNKYYYWEKRGVPYRVEVGAREAREGSVTLFSRAERKRRKVKLEELGDALSVVRGAYLEAMWERAKEKVLESMRKNAKLLDIEFEEGACLEAEEDTGLNTIGKVIGGPLATEDMIGKVLFGKKY